LGYFWNLCLTYLPFLSAVVIFRIPSLDYLLDSALFGVLWLFFMIWWLWFSFVNQISGQKGKRKGNVTSGLLLLFRDFKPEFGVDNWHLSHFPFAIKFCLLNTYSTCLLSIPNTFPFLAILSYNVSCWFELKVQHLRFRVLDVYWR